MSLLVSPELMDPIEPKVAGRLLGLWQKRTANIFRGVIETQAKSSNPVVVAQYVRGIVKEEFSPGFFTTFAFGAVLHFPSSTPSPQDILGYVDTKARLRGTWQWVVVTSEVTSRAYGVHTWTEGYLTPVYADMLEQLEAKGYTCESIIKPPDKFWVKLWRIRDTLWWTRAVLLGLGALLFVAVMVVKALGYW
jgi:hypothetical protein